MCFERCKITDMLVNYGENIMKREEKNQLTRCKILDSACKEFAVHGFEAGSVNAICQDGGVSKGIIYHYFSSKEELYLECLTGCFDGLTSYLEKGLAVLKEDESDCILSAYFDLRMAYFREHEIEAQLFCEAVLTPPECLKCEIAECRQSFDELNAKTMKKILKNQPLRDDLKEEDMLRVFQQFHDFLNARYRNTAKTKEGLKHHEQDCKNVLEILLYGMISR